MAPFIYEKDFLPSLGFDTSGALFSLVHTVPWVRIGSTPRHECWMAPRDYTYGAEAFARTYQGLPMHPLVETIRDRLTDKLGVTFDGCFLNRYDGSRDHLGWHADDSPEMDDARPIAVISVGREREIWFRPKGKGGPATDRLLLHAGSALIMPPGMQDGWEHRIPKDDRQSDETRISMTFRGLVS